MSRSATSRRRCFLVGVVVVASLAGAARSEAASITWSAAQNITGDADVSTTGTLVAAFNLGGDGVAATTVNGVLFNPFVVTGPATTATSGNFTFASAGGLSSANTGSSDPPFSTLSASYRALLGSASGGPRAPLTLTMSGLTPGQGYEFEWWLNFSFAPTAVSITSTAGNSVTLRENTTGFDDGGVGQFAIGTFTADATTQVISFSSGDPGFNGFELRSTSVAAPAVPEPASLSLLALGLAGLGARRWRQRRQSSGRHAA